MQCDDARPLIGATLDGEATPGQSEQAADHLQGCAECRAWRNDAVRLDSLFAAPVEVTPLEPAAVAALSSAGVAAGLGSTGAVAAAAAAAVVPGQRGGRSGGLVLGGALLATAIVAGTAFGLLSGGGGDTAPITLPTTLESTSPTAEGSPSESPRPSVSVSVSPSASRSPSASASASASVSRSASPSVSPSVKVSASPAATVAPQPLTATARAGVLDLVLRVNDSRPARTISITLRVVNNTERPVTYRSPSCGQLTLRIDGQIKPDPSPGCEREYETYTLDPGQAHTLNHEHQTTPGEHSVEGLFAGEDPEPSPDPAGGKPTPTPGPKQVQNATAGPITVRVG